MNKKLLFAGSFVLTGLIGFTSLGKGAIQTLAYTNYLDNLLFADKVETFKYEGGVKTPDSATYYKNNDKGYKIEERYASYDDEKKALVDEYLTKYEYNDQFLNTKKTASVYNEEDQTWEEEIEDVMAYNASGQLVSWINYYFDEGTKEVWFERTYTYNDKGYLTKIVDDHSQGYFEERYTYDTNNNCTKVESYEHNDQKKLVLISSIESEYNADNDITIAVDREYNRDTEQVNYKFVMEYTYSSPHKLSETIEAEYEGDNEQALSLNRITKVEYSYSGNEVTQTLSVKNSVEGQYSYSEKTVELDTKDLFYSIRYYYEEGAWSLDWGEKEVFSFDGDTYLGSISYDADEGATLVWDIKYEETVTYAKPVGGSGFPIGALIGIIVGAIVVVYVTGYVLWKKAVLAFLAKPAFGKVFGWFDKIIVKIGGLFKKK